MTVSDRIGRGKAPDLAWGSPSEAGQACLESSPGMPRDTLARVARDSGDVSSRTARPKNHTSHTTDAHKIVSESARLFGEAPQPNRPSSMIRTLLFALLGAAAAQEVQMEVRAGVRRCPQKNSPQTEIRPAPAARRPRPGCPRPPGHFVGPRGPTAAPFTHTNNLPAPTLPAPTFESPHRSPRTSKWNKDPSSSTRTSRRS